MVNLLGDVWNDGEPAWDRVLAMHDLKLHLYGKDGAREGRKMGHLTVLGDTPSDAAEKALNARRSLKPLDADSRVLEDSVASTE